MDSDVDSDLEALAPPSQLLDVSSQIQSLCRLGSSSGRFSGRFLAPAAVKNALELSVHYLSQHYSLTTLPVDYAVEPDISQLPFPDNPSAADPNSPIEVRHNIKINRRTTLGTLYVYPPGALLEYPSTSSTGYVGHLFNISKSTQWYNPIKDVLYSRGKPDGQTKTGSEVFCDVLVTADGIKVPCQESHSTCEFTCIYDNC